MLGYIDPLLIDGDRTRVFGQDRGNRQLWCGKVPFAEQEHFKVTSLHIVITSILDLLTRCTVLFG